MSRHGGNLRDLAQQAGCRPEEILDFSASVNPLGPPESLRAVISRNIDGLVYYPDPQSAELAEALARKHQVPAGQVVVGNGSTELLFALAGALDYARAVIPVPSYVDYSAAVRLAGRPVEEIPLGGGEAAGVGLPVGRIANPSVTSAPLPDGLAIRPTFEIDWAGLEDQLRDGDLVLLGQPNNPTSLWLDRERLGRLAHARPGTWFVVDEAFAGFVEGGRSMVEDLEENVVVLRSLTKLYAIAGLRLGYAVAHAAAAERLRARILPWSVNSLAQAVGLALLDEDDYVDETVRYVAARRRELADALGGLEGLHVYPGTANFLLARIDRPDIDASTLAERLLRRRIAIRTFPPGQHLDGRFFRIAVRTVEENAALCDSLAEIVGVARGEGRGTRDAVWGSGVGNRGTGENRIDPSSLISHPSPLAPRPSPLPAPHSPLLPRHSPLPTPHSPLPTPPSPLATRHSPLLPRRTPALMFQGTSSSAGKSLLTAAFCRILLQDGFHAAPFKAQNMSLNSFVTADGREMGRAQVVQAQACRLEPDVRMNPILLKPNSDTGCQVIVRGKPLGNMRVGEYVDYKREGFAVACQSYESLAAEFDVVVLEGAGSPGEVNLKSHDIVNMRMARHAGAPVLIVGDIDRGGVFASFVGTMEVLAAWERKLVAGWVVNRFRGDAGLLGPALDYTLRHTGRPVLGVVPYLDALNLPEEDSVEFKATRKLPSPLGRGAGGEGESRTDPSWRAASFPESPHPNPLPEGEGETGAGMVEIALVDLPHLSNFSDFDAFRVEPDVRLRIVRGPSDLDQPDALLVGGSKNTLGDLAYLRSGGLAEGIDRLARSGRCEVVGICGGFQMLGQQIRDPLGIESGVVRLAPAATPAGEDPRGLGLLGVNTVLAAEKTLRRTAACHAASGLEVTGYEIHHGQTDVGACVPEFRRSDGEILGAASADGRVWGTYLHGVFDDDAFRRWFVDRLRVHRGLTPIGRVVGRYDIEPALERLAEAVRRALPVEQIYRMMGLR